MRDIDTLLQQGIEYAIISLPYIAAAGIRYFTGHAGSAIQDIVSNAVSDIGNLLDILIGDT